MWMYQIGSTTQTFMSDQGNLRYLVNATKDGITLQEFFSQSQHAEDYILRMRSNGYSCTRSSVTKLV